MAKASPGIFSFAGGELSPLLGGRQDVQKYAVGCRKMLNFLPLIQGPARLRGGTRFIAEVKDSGLTTQLFAFKVKETDAVVIEFGEQYNRFYADRATINMEDAPTWSNATTYDKGDFVTYSGAQYYSLADSNLNQTPGSAPAWWVAQDVYEIPSPYLATHLTNDDESFNLSIVQSIDVLYIASGDYQQRKLSRYSDTDWRYSLYSPVNGPFDPQNIDKTVSITTDDVTGTITITNDAAGIPIAEGTTSRLIRIEETDKSATKPWEAYKRIAAEGANPLGEERRSDGKFYRCTTDSVVPVGQIEYRTGTVRPTHTEGIYADGDGEPLYSGTTLFAGIVGVDWEYLHAGYGVARIDSVAGGGATASATVLQDLPDSIVSPGSYRWSLGSWYEGNWPASVSFVRNRLAFGGTDRLNLSQSDDYESHAPDEFGEVLADSAIDVNISVGQGDGINWMKEIVDGLLIGSNGQEFICREITRSQVFGPANVTIRKVGDFGSRKILPISIDGTEIFIQTGGRIVREAQYQTDVDQLIAADLTAFAEHITESGIVGTVYAKNPNSTLWCWRADGKLAALTYRKDQEVVAWSLHDVGGVVESAAVIPSPTPGIDDLYLIVRREIDGDTKRYVEVLLPPYTSPNDPFLSCYHDCSLTYDGAQNTALVVPAGALIDNAEDVVFTAGSSLFSADSVGRKISKRTYDADTGVWTSSVAVIVEYVSPTVVKADILHPFPEATTLGLLEWRLSATEITGLDHLNGETVRVTVDGCTHPDCVVASGSITLATEGSIVHVGLAMDGVLQPMNLEAGGDDGTSQGKIKRFSTVTFRLFESSGFQYGHDLTSQMDAVEFRTPGDSTDEATALYSGDVSVAWPEGHETDGRITILADRGLPLTVCAIYPQVHVESHRTGGTR